MREERAIDLELIDHRRIIPLISFAHSEDDIRRLVSALRDLVEAHRDRAPDTLPKHPTRPQLRSESVMLPRDAFFAPTESVPFTEAAGRISAEFVTPYPPGIPAMAAGERYSGENIDYLQQFVSAGGFIEGAADPELETVRVVAE